MLRKTKEKTYMRQILRKNLEKKTMRTDAPATKNPDENDMKTDAPKSNRNKNY